MDQPLSSRARRSTRRSVLGLIALVAGLTASGCVFVPPPPPPSTGPVVVFDIDGTLTDDELSETPHPGGAQAVAAYVDKGYEVVT